MLQPLIERQLALFTECEHAGQYEAAYHCLMAALHLAEDASDAGALERIAAAVRSLETDIESARPPHQLSRAQAESRGQQPLCSSLRVHVDAVRLRLRSLEQRGRAAASAPPPA